jgi:hypothetical protein
MRYRPASQVPPRREGPRCSGCGREARNPVARAEVATTWLLPGAGGPVERRFCRDCAPSGLIDEVVCMRCGDGPLLAGALAAGDEPASVAVTRWLSGAGWRLAGPMCPACVRELSR